jgi:hypothetical protein
MSSAESRKASSATSASSSSFCVYYPRLVIEALQKADRISDALSPPAEAHVFAVLHETQTSTSAFPRRKHSNTKKGVIVTGKERHDSSRTLEFVGLHRSLQSANWAAADHLSIIFEPTDAIWEEDCKNVAVTVSEGGFFCFESVQRSVQELSEQETRIRVSVSSKMVLD